MQLTHHTRRVFTVLFVIVLLSLQGVTSNAYTTTAGTSYTWRMTNDFTGTGLKTLPVGWKRHRDGTWPTAGIYEKVSISTVPIKPCVEFKVASGVDAGKSFKTCFTATGGKYHLRIGYLHNAWYDSLFKEPLIVTTQSGTSFSVTNQVTTSVSGTVNASFPSLKASVTASATFNSAFNQTVTNSVTQQYTLNPNNFEQHSTIRIRMGYLQRFYEYNAVTYRYYPSTKTLGAKVDLVNGKKVTGKYLAPNSNPSVVVFWAGY